MILSAALAFALVLTAGERHGQSRAPVAQPAPVRGSWAHRAHLKDEEWMFGPVEMEPVGGQGAGGRMGGEVD